MVKEMEETDEAVLGAEHPDGSMHQKELDLEDAMAVRQLKDVNQAERLLVVRRKKRIATATSRSLCRTLKQQAQIQLRLLLRLRLKAKMQEIQMQAQIDYSGNAT